MRVKLLGTLSLMLLVVVGAMVVPKMGAARPSWVVMPARVVIPVVVSFSIAVAWWYQVYLVRPRAIRREGNYLPLHRFRYNAPFRRK